jgi:glycosyltransferase involved in cell wall biosynthesis
MTRRIFVLLLNAHNRTGVARATINLVNALADDATVVLTSVYQHEGEPLFALSDKVELRYLIPMGPIQAKKRRFGGPLAATPSIMGQFNRATGLTDQAISDFFEQLEPGDTVITARPELHLASTHLSDRTDIVRIGWDHYNFITRFQMPDVKNKNPMLDRSMPLLDACVVLTDADLVDYQDRYPGTKFVVIRNLLAHAVDSELAAHDQPVVLAAGRLDEVKGFDRLLAAWGRVQDAFPEWRCEIYGAGADLELLQRIIDGGGLRASLPGYTTQMTEVMRSSAIYAMTSRSEGFPMVLIEALSVGLPPVAFDCPRGPSEVIVDQRNGLLIEDGDIAAYAEALGSLMADSQLRRQMGEAGLEDAQRYRPERIAGDWLELIDDLAAAKRL